MPDQAPSDIAGIKARLRSMLAQIGDPEVRAQTAALWKEQYEASFPVDGAEAFFDLTPPDPLELAFFELNDVGNARRLQALAAGNLLWIDTMGWAGFDGRRWSVRDGENIARRLAQSVAGHIAAEAKALSELMGDWDEPNAKALADRYGDWCTPSLAKNRVKKLRDHGVQSGNFTRTNAMLGQAKSIPELVAWPDDFDKDPLVFNVENGTLRFSLGRQGWEIEFREFHDPADMLMHIANVSYDPKAQCPQWLARLELVQPNPAQRAIFPRMYGQCLTGLTDCEEFYVHKGRGGDGKTKTHEVIADLMGDYYRHSSTKTFLQASIQKSGSEHRSDLVRLRGDIRMVLCDEPPPRSKWDGETLKQATGGGNITARGSGDKTEMTFRPRWKLFIEVNPLPDMPGDDKGFRRRFRLILWDVDLSKLPGGFEPPDQLRQRLLAEKSGILNWLIAGCLEWLGDRRVPVPEIETEATADFWAQTSPLGEWLDEECDLADRSALTGAKELHEAFKAWAQRNDVDTERWNATRFGRELSQRQIIAKKSTGGVRVRKGIRLRSDADRLDAARAQPATDHFDEEDWPA